MKQLRDNLPLICMDPKCRGRDHGSHAGVTCSSCEDARMELDVETLVRWCYYQGWKRGVHDYAVHHDGQLLVGVMRRDYQAVVERGPDAAMLAVDLNNHPDQIPTND